MKKYDNIVFDLGGVIIDLQRHIAVEALEKLGIADASEILGLYRQKEPVLALETGHATAGDFFDNMRSVAGNDSISDRAFQDAFCSFLADIPTRRLSMLRNLRKCGYKLYVLSNTNPVMFNGWITEHFRKEGLTVNDYFDGIVVSFQELCCKPDIKIFKTVLNRYNLDGNRTLMLDDSEANCIAASQAGMHSRRVDNTSMENSMIAIASELIEDEKS